MELIQEKLYIKKGQLTGFLIIPSSSRKSVNKRVTVILFFLVQNFEKIEKKQNVSKIVGITYKMKDSTSVKIKVLYENFENKLCKNYLENKSEMDKMFPIITQDIFHNT